MIKTFEASGKTVEEAIDNALLLANTTIENVDIEVLELGGRGVFGFGKKDARVRISLEVEEPEPKEARPAKPAKTAKPPVGAGSARPQPAAQDEAPVVKEMIRAKSAPAAPDEEAQLRESQLRESQLRESRLQTGKRGRAKEKESAAPAPAVSAEAKPAPKRAVEHDRGYRVGEGAEAATLSAEAMRFLGPIFHSLKVEPHEETQVKEGILWLVFSGAGLGSLIGRRGETLNALQYLTNLAVNRDKKEHVRLVLDVEGYRAGREETLVALAKKMADKAYRTGRRVELEPMNPHERRIVHIALQNDKRVDTASQGEEPYRRVVINRRRTEQNNRKRPGGKGEHFTPPAKAEQPAPSAQDRLSLSQQLGMQFSEQMENRR